MSRAVLLVALLGCLLSLVVQAQEPPHPAPEGSLSCSLQIWCTPTAPCIVGQTPQSDHEHQYALVSFDMSYLTINYSDPANVNATDYVAYDEVNTYVANVCAPTKQVCPPPYNTPDNYGLAIETSNPAICFPTAHKQAPSQFTLVDPLDVTQGVQSSYVGGEYSGCTGSVARTVNYVFKCGTTWPLNPFLTGSTINNNPCQYEFVFETAAACPIIEWFFVPIPPKKSPVLSGGSIFLITLLIALFIYVVGFASLNYYRGGRTFSSVVPHPLFWAAFASNVAAGVHVTKVFIHARCSAEARAEEERNDYADIGDGGGRAGELESAEAHARARAAALAEREREHNEAPANYAAHFASDRDDIGGDYGPPLARKQEPSYDSAFD